MHETKSEPCCSLNSPTSPHFHARRLYTLPQPEHAVQTRPIGPSTCYHLTKVEQPFVVSQFKRVYTLCYTVAPGKYNAGLLFALAARCSRSGKSWFQVAWLGHLFSSQARRFPRWTEYKHFTRIMVAYWSIGHFKYICNPFLKSWPWSDKKSILVRFIHGFDNVSKSSPQIAKIKMIYLIRTLM